MIKQKKEIIITRVFADPKELIWKAWTDPAMVKKWWGPKDFTAPSIQIDLREGGKYRYCMQTPDGVKLYSGGVFHEIVPHERIVLTDMLTDENGNSIKPTNYGLSRDFPIEMRVVVTFEELDGKTTLTITYPKPESKRAFRAMVESQMDKGWSQSLDKLEESLKDN